MALPASDGRRTMVDRARESWIRRLIDLSRRNNLLYFRDLKTGTLDLTQADRKVLDALMEGSGVTLAQLMPGADETKLFATAREIFRRAQSNLEEKGLQTLFLAVGMATWAPDDEGRPPEAAVLLVPVSLEGRGTARTTVLKRTGDIQVNLVLLHILQTVYGCKVEADALLAEAGVAEDDGLPFNPDHVFAGITAAARKGVRDFSIGWRAVLGNFSFQKMAMVKDLQERGDAMAGHELIAAIAGDSPSVQRFQQAQVDVDPGQFDETPPDAEFFVLDTDSSQQRVAALALQGQSLVIQGPPGTGKSQTIANLIAGLAAAGRRVLFVAEKRAALEVVQQRLEREGIGHLYLDLHGADLTRKAIMGRMGASLTLIQNTLPVQADDVHRRFTDTRRRLVEHVRRLHVKRAPSGLSLYDIQGKLLRLPKKAATTVRWRGAELDRITSEAAGHAEDLLRQLAGFADLYLGKDPSPWTGARLAEGAAAQAAVDLVGRIAGDWWQMQAEISQVAGEAGLKSPTTLEQAESLLQLATEVTELAPGFAPEIWQADLDGLAAALAPASHGFVTRTFAWLGGSFRDAVKQVRALRKPGHLTDAPRLAGEVARAAGLRRRWRDLTLTGGPPVPVTGAAVALGRVRTLSGHLQTLTQSVPLGDYATLDLAGVQATIEALQADGLTPHSVAGVTQWVKELTAMGAGATLEDIRRADIAPAGWHLRFRYAWLSSCLDKARLEDPALIQFKGRTHDSYVAEFRKLDRQRLKLAADRVRRRHAEHAVTAMNKFPDQAALVQHEAEKKSRHIPLRRLLAQAPDVLTALFPCWMASPLSVSQLMDADRRYFDVVLFDEASQVLPEDAVPAILRGGQLVVAGDEHQLPPTLFFADGADEAEEVDEELSAAVGFESLLKLSAAFLPKKMLQWHYRSRDEALIAFSNRHIYDNGLVTFPGTGGEHAVAHVLVEATGSDDADSSAAEVARVVDLILAHAERQPDMTLGVIAMGIKHATRVQSALDKALAGRPDLEEFFNPTALERFFIKNLERVQGDERDAIILTVGYGKDRSGRLPYRFGPLLQDGGERRLNVAVTRARKKLTLVSSFTHLDMDPGRSKSRGVELLRLYLHYAASQGRGLSEASAGAEGRLSEFEEDVKAALEGHGIHLVPHWGASVYRIDLVARHPQQPDRFVLAIECDGPSYVKAPTARDRDRLRQQHLENLGWRFHRIWSTDWFLRREEEIERAVQAFEAAVEGVAAGPTAAVPSPAPVPAPSANGRGERPWVPVRDKIQDYHLSELVALIRWIRADGRLRLDDQIIDEMVKELGFARRGARIEARVREAIARA